MFGYGLRDVRVVTAINMILLFFTVLLILILLKDLLMPKLQLSTVKDLKLESRKLKVSSLKEFEPILRNNPFGFSAGELKPITAITPDHGTMPVDMRLIGTVSGGVDYAIFITKEGKQEVFKRGERLFGLGRLERVYKDKVVISEHGTKKTIPLEDILTFETVRSADRVIGEAVNRLGREIVKNPENNTFILSQEGISQALGNPAQLMTDARLQPNYVNGKQEGFILREVRYGGIYQSLGLNNGDILLRINGQDITNPEIALKAFTALKGMDRIDLDIIRNGTRMTLNYLIR